MSAPRSAGDPFTDANADIIVRSSDTVDFRVHKMLLTKLFHSFEDMLGAPMLGTGTQASHEGLPVVELAEPYEVLDHLLRLLYPVPFPDTSGNWPILLAVCIALDKYGAKFYPLPIVHALLLAAKASDGPGPGIVYVLSCRHPSLNDLLVEVAKLSLHDVCRLDNVPKDLLSGMSATQYHAFIDYQNRCRQAAQNATIPENIIDWLPIDKLPAGDPTPGPCTCFEVKYLAGYEWDVLEYGPTEDDVVLEKADCEGHLVLWLSNYLDAVRAAFKTEISGSVVSRSHYVVAAFLEAMKCAMCSKTEAARMVSFVEKLADRVAEKINAVPFHVA
eukprot:GHVU01079291.1.p1 GENE.GHVU01079291.1~~GHVU01079291.1.p1  ORF type:complete len:331 (+),score=22.51 GHVU01079291.1:121-1113(+)